ncbi:MAG: helix-turn-helix transcriptional regulator [Polyangiales bacterium]
MEQREKSMGAGASAKADAMTEAVRPARYVAESDSGRDDSAGQKPKAKKPSAKTNRLRETRIEKMMSKAELARRANLSVLTIDRVEKGLGCRMDTKRKILEALGLSLADRVRVFGEEE